LELCKYLFILVILETHYIRELKAGTDLDHLVKLRLLLFLYLIPVNILHLPYLGLPHTKDGSDIEVGMKLIPKPVVDAQILAHCIGIYLSRLFDQLPTLGIVND
jgi:Asp-tRNA(Asn)/Glu-tRNA(Gln) amidotransferase A subunit family amidase